MAGGFAVTLVTLLPLHAGDVRAPADVFGSIYQVFLWLGTLVGVVVITYTLYNAYKYRDRGTDAETADDTGEKADGKSVGRPEMGELPTGGGGGRKLFLSFGISAVIVLSLIGWTYSTLLYVENEPTNHEDALEVDVVGHQFSWEFIYPNGNSETGTLRVPQGRMVVLNVTSADVFHNFGIPELRVKSDAIPGQTTQSWFVAEETGEYAAHCYELCGAGHSYMDAKVVVMEPDAYQEWYAGTGETSQSVSADGTHGRLATPGGEPA